jgi:hypothetical protein
MMAGKTVFVPALSNKLTLLAPRLFPRRLVAKVVMKAQERR